MAYIGKRQGGQMSPGETKPEHTLQQGLGQRRQFMSDSGYGSDCNTIVLKNESIRVSGSGLRKGQQGWRLGWNAKKERRIIDNGKCTKVYSGCGKYRIM